MGSVRKDANEVSVVAPISEFLDFMTPIDKNAVPLGVLIALAAKRKLEDLKQVPFHLSRTTISVEDKNLVVTFKRLPE